MRYFIIITDLANSFKDAVPVAIFLDGDYQLDADEVVNLEDDMTFVAGPLYNGEWFSGCVNECQIYKVM